MNPAPSVTVVRVSLALVVTLFLSLVTVVQAQVAPAQPTGLKAVAGDSQVRLTWTNPNNAAVTGYQIKRWTGNTEPSPGSWADVPGSGKDTTSHVVSGLTNGTTYTFRIRAVAGPATGTQSDPVSATPAAPPAKPGRITKTGGDGQVRLTWTNPNNAAVTGYQIKRWTGNTEPGPGSWADVPGSGKDTTSHVVSGLTNGRTYTFRIRAMVSATPGPASDAVSATPAGPPAKPGRITKTVGNGQVTLSWNNPNNAAITGYQIRHRSFGKWTGWTDIPNSDASTTSHVVSGLTNGVLYNFRIRAMADSVAGEKSGSVNAIPALPVPSKPTGLKAMAVSSQVTLTWNNPNNAAITGYQIDRMAVKHGAHDELLELSGNWSEIPGSDASTTRHVVKDLEDGVTYTFRIRAMAGPATGTQSDPVSATPGISAPSKPTGLKAVAGIGEVTLSWDDPKNADITKYQVKYWTGTPESGKWVDIERSDADTTSHVVTGLTNGVLYRFRVRAVAGPFEGIKSSSVGASPVAPPAKPTEISVRAGNGQVTLSWDNPNGATIWQYQIKQWTGSSETGNWADIPANIKVTRTGTFVDYTVKGLTNSVTYSFRIRGVAGSAGSIVGTESDVINATPVMPTPGRPLGLKSVTGDGQATLSWNNLGNPYVTKYQVQWQSVLRSSPGQIISDWSDWADIDPSDKDTTRYMVTGLINSLRYNYRIRAVAGSVPGRSSTIVVISAATPVKPVVRAVGEDGQVRLRWNKLNNAAIGRYQIKQWTGSSETGDWMDILRSGASTTSHVVKYLTNGTTYSFRIRAVAGTGVYGTPSDPVSAKPVGRKPVVTAISGSGQVRLNWGNLGDTAVTGYQIKQWTGNTEPNPGSWTNVPGSGASTTSHLVTSLTNGTTYSFRIRAMVSAAPGPASDAASATPAAPPAKPGRITTAVGNGQVRLSWSDPNNAAITRYQVKYWFMGYGDTRLVTDWADIPGSDASTTSHVVRLLINNVRHSFQIRAMVGTTPGPASDAVSATPAVPDPRKPVVTAEAGYEYIDLSWSNPNDASITGYQIKQWTGNTEPSPGSWADIPGSDANTTSHFLENLTTSVLYNFRIRAMVGTAPGPASDPVSAKPDGSSIRSIVVTAETPASGQVRLRWSKPDITLFTDSYQVKYWTGSSESSDWADIPGSDASTTSHVVTGLANGTTYNFRIRSMYVELGTVFVEVMSEVVSVTPVSSQPVVTAMPGNTWVRLSWNNLKDPAVRQYQIKQWTGSSEAGSWTDISVRRTDVTSHVVTGLTNGTTYNFRIRAMVGGTARTPSDAVSATPVAPPAKPDQFTVQEGNGQVTLNWKNPNDPAITKYQMKYWFVGSDSAGLVTDWVDIPGSGKDTTSHVVTGLTNNNLYVFVIRAVANTLVGRACDSARGTPSLNPAGVTLSTRAVTVTEASGNSNTDTYTVVLNTRPTGTVTVTPTSSNSGVATVSPASLTFTSANWNTAQPVTVTGVDDSTDGDRSTTITHTASGGDYGSVSVPDVSVTLTDDDTVGVTVTQTAGSTATTEAGGTDTINVVLDTQPTSNVTIAVSSSDTSEGTVAPVSLIFTSSNWSTAQTVTVTGVDDNLADGDKSYNIVLAAAVSTDTNYHGIDPADVSVTNTDNDTVGVTLSTRAVTVTEASGNSNTDTYTVVLNTRPTGTVTVTPTSSNSGVATVSPASLTFTSANWNTAQPVTVTGVDDSTDGDRSTTITHTASGGDYGSVSVPDVSVTLTDDDTVGVTVTQTAGSTATTEAGGTDTINVVLDTQPTSNVTIAVSSSDTSEGTVAPVSLIFTSSNWSTAQTVTVTGVDDNLADGDKSYNIVLAAAVSTDTNYHGIDPADVSVTNTDNDTVGVTLSTRAVTVTEASGNSNTDTYTVVLNTRPTGTVTVTPTSSNSGVATVSPASLTFTSANWNTAQPVTVTGVDDSTDGDRSTTITHTASGGDYGSVSVPDVSVTLTDDDTVGVTVTQTAGSTATTEAGGTDTINVVLDTQPTSNVTIAVSSSDTSEGTVAPVSLIFTSSNWSTAQTVTVTGVDDNLADGDKSYNIVLAAAVSTDTNYHGIDPADVSVTNTDNDTVGVTLSTRAVTVTEASGNSNTDTYTVVLNTRPTGTVTVTPTSSNSGVATVSPASLTFTSANWNTAQPVTVTGVDDSTDGDRSTTITHTASGGDYGSVSVPDVSVTLTDDDTVGVTVTQTAGSTATTEAGGTDTINVVLDTQPTSNVTIAVSSSDTSEGTVAPVSLIFTSSNWSTAQTVTVTGVDDNLADGDKSYNIVLAAAVSTDTNYHGIDPADVSVTNTDNDTVGVTLSTRAVTVTEASGNSNTDTYTVVLNTRPTGTVTVTPTSSNSGVATVSPASLTFTSANWNTAQPVTVTGVDDSTDGDRSTTITHTASGGDYGSVSVPDVSVTLTDDDTVGVTVTQTAGSTATTEAGGTDTINVVLDTQPTSNVTIAVSSSDTSEGTVAPVSLIFTSSNWSTAQTVTVTGVDDNLADGDKSYNIVLAAAVSTDTNYHGIDPADVSVTNTDNDTVGVTLSTRAVTVTEASGNSNTDTYTVVLNTRPTGTVTVTPTSSNSGVATVSPASLTFTSANWNTAQPVTVTGVDDSTDGDRSTTITHTASGGDYGSVSVPDVSVTLTDDDTVGVTVTQTAGSTATTEAGGTDTINVVLDTQPTSNVTIAVSSSDTSEGTVAPVSLIFTSSNWSTAQTVTVTGVDDNLADGDKSYNIVLAAAVSTDTNYHGIDPADVSVTNTDNDTVGVTLSTRAVTVTEASGNSNTDTYTVVLNTRPTGTVTVTPTSSNSGVATVSPASLTFTSANWNTAQPVTVTGVDDSTDGDRSTTITHTASGGDYGSVSVPDVSVTLTDDDTVGVTVTQTAGSTATTEAGGTDTINVVLDTQPTSNVTIAVSSSDTSEGTVAPVSLIFTSSNWSTAQTVTVTGVDDNLADGDKSYNIVLAAAVSTDTNYHGIDPADVSVTNTDNDTVGVTLSTRAVTVTEASGNSNTDTYTVVLNTRPTGTVTVTPTSSNSGVATVSPASLTFTSANWNTAQPVTVTGVDDSTDGDRSTTITHTASGGDYGSVSVPDVSVTLTDDDTVGVTVTQTAGSTATTEAGGTDTINVVLDTQPTSNVTIAVSSSDTSEGTVAPVSLIFTSSNWSTAQTVTVTGVDDNLADGDKSYNIVLAAAVSTDTNYHGIDPADVSVTNTDNDTVGVTLSTRAVTVTEASGNSNTDTYTVVLNTRPTGTVTVTPTSSNSGVATVSPASLTFTSANWNTAQPVTVTGVDDSTDGDRSTTITHTASGGDYGSVSVPDVSVTLTDDDTVGVTVTQTAGSTATTEAGGTDTINVVLDTQPTSNVTIAVSSSDTSEGTVAPVSLIFTSSNWSTAQTVTVTGVDDNLADGDKSYNIVLAAAVSTDTNYHGIDPADVSVTNTDNDTVGVTLSTRAVTVTEASGNSNTDTYTVVLNTRPTGTVTVTPTSSNSGVATVSPASLTFTSANWNTAQPVTVTGVDDSTDGDRSTTITHTASGGDYGSVSVPDVSVTLTDDDTVGVTVTQTAGSTATTEAGGTDTINVVLDTQPTSNVTIAVSSSDTSEGTVAPVSLIFTSSNWSTAQTVTVTGVDDNLADGDKSYNIVLAAAVSTDTNYHGIDPADVSVTNTDNDTVGVTLSTRAVTVTEASGNSNTDTYTVVLNTRPTGTVTVTPTSSNSGVATVSPASLTFTSANWNTAQPVTVTGVDDSTDGDRSTTITHTASGGDYGSVSVPDVSVTLTDDDTVGVTVTQTAGSTATTEAGGTDTINVVLDTQPTSNVTIAVSSSDTSEGTVAPVSLIFTSSNWSTAQTVTVTGVDDNLADGDKSYNIVLAAAVSTDTNYHGIDPADVSVTNTDNDTVGVTLSTRAVTVTEASGNSNTDTYTVVLNTRPTGTVTVTPTSSNSGVATVSPASLTFTSANWNTAQPVTVTGVDDSTDGDRSTTITHTASGGDYGSVSVPDVSVTLTDDDTVGVTVTQTAGSTATTEAGGTDTINVVLDTQPTSNVTIAVSSSDTSEGTVAPVSLIFTSSNWSTAQTVTVTGVDDNLADGDKSYNIVLAAAVSTDTNYHGIDPADVSVTNTDNDTVGVTLSTRAVTVTEASGNSNTDTYTVVLNTRPTGTVTVTPTSSNSGVATVSPASLTFTSANWNTAQPVTVTGVDDSTDGDRSTTITHTASGGDYGSVSVPDVSVTLTDDDTVGVTVTQTAGSTATTEAGGTDTINVVLDTQPTSNVTIAVSSSDTSEGTVAPVSLIFTSSNWSTAQTVTVTGVDDNLADGDKSYNIVLAAAVSTDTNYHGIDPADVSVTNTDNDTVGVTLSTSAVTVTEASGNSNTDTYTVVLNTRPTGTVTVTPTSSNSGVATVSPASLTFTSANWNTAQPVTVTGVDDRVDADRSTTITHTVTGGGYDSVRIPDVAVILVDDDTVDALLFGFAGDTLKVTEADGAMHRNYYQIVLKSQPSGDVTVTPTSGDTGIATITPSSLTFTADNWAESQSIAVTGVDDHVDAGDRSTAITHSASGGGYDSVRIPDVVVTLIDDDVAGVTVSETDGSTATTESGGSDSISVVLDSQPTAEVTLAVTSSDTTEGTVDKSSLVFTPHNWATAQSITVTGVDDRLDDGEQSYKIELGIAASNDSNYNGINPDDVVVTSKVKVSVEITGVAPGTTKIEGNTITTQVDGTDVQLTLPAGHDVTEVAFSVPRSGPSAQAGVTFGDEPAYVGIRIDAQLPSSSSASVCLEEPAGLSGTLFVYHLTDGANTWEKLLPALAAPNGYVCGKTKDFSVFVVGSPMPVFGSAFVDDYVWTVGEAVDVELPAATGGDGPITYRLSPALPAGLEFEAPVRTITGTPNEVFATTEFTYTARDTDGHTGQLQFRVTVQAAEVKERSRALAVALASFGRTVAGEAVDVIGRRFIAAPVARSGITLGGTALSSVGSGSASAVLSLAEARGESGATVDGLNPGLITWRGVSARELFSRSDFVLPLQGTKEDRVRTGWTFWGQGSAGRFSSEAKAIETDGELHTGYMGLDYRFGSNHNALAGVAFSHSAGEVDYAVAGDFLLVNGERGGITGEVDLAMTSVLPYVHYTPRLGLGIWGLAGAGSGEVKLKDQGGRVETDVRMVMAAVGVRQRLKTWRGVDFAVKSDVLAVQLKTDAAAGLEAVTGDARRARLALEMGAERVLSPDALLRPDIEFSGRWDEGDADNGIGVEISGGVAYVQSRLGLRLGVRGRYLLAHEESEFADWGGSFALQIGEGLGGHGLWLSYEPQWGAPASGVEQLWDSEGIREVGGAGRMKFDLGYGMTTRGRGWLVTPYGGVLTTDQDTRYRLGAQAEVDKSMDISLEGVRRENAEGATEHGIFLRWKILL